MAYIELVKVESGGLPPRAAYRKLPAARTVMKDANGDSLEPAHSKLLRLMADKTALQIEAKAV